MSDRLSRDNLRVYSARKKRPAVESWLRSLGWCGRCDADGWPIVSQAWWNDQTNGTASANQEYHVDIDALRRVA